MIKSFLIKGLSLAVVVGALVSCSTTEVSQQSTDASFKVGSMAFTDDAAINQKVKDLLAKMSLEEKVGQMTQVNVNTILVGSYGSADGTIDMGLLKKAVVEYKVGSILNAVPSAYTVDKWHDQIKIIQDIALTNPNKIPVLYGIDAIHGATFTANSTLLPHNIGLSATRNTELVKAGAKLTANEVRASGIRWNFDPVLDIGRQPLWPRFAESFGEDVTLIRQMGVATIKGYEEDGLENPTAVASCMKHFVGYSATRTGKDRTPAYIPDVELREYYLPQFKDAVEAGSSTIMINSASVNGVPAHANSYLLKDVLRGEFGFKGLAVSDWEDIIRLHTKHKVAKTPKEAVKIAVNAGIDMSMVPHDFSFFTYLVELVNEGEVSMERIDEACGRILALKFRVGLFDNAYAEEGVKANFGKPEYKQIAKNAALESITLLKNDENILPLGKDKKYFVCGPGALSLSTLNGCWSYTWQGTNEKVYPEGSKTILAAIQDKVGEDNVDYMAYESYERKKNYKVDVLKESISDDVDYIIICLGEDAYAESPGVIDDLTLDERQLALAQACIETGKPVIVVLTEGRPRVIRKIVDDSKAILQAYWPGSQGAPAIVDVLFGDYNPNGKLPYSYPRATGNIVPYDCKYADVLQELVPGRMTETGYHPEWPFGFGLSYTTFEYSDIKLNSTTLKGDATLTVTVDVTNSGKVDGKIAIDLYTRDHFATLVPSVKRLRKFTKIELKAGEKKTVTFKLDKSDLAFAIDGTNFVTEAGKFDVIIDAKKATFEYVE